MTVPPLLVLEPLLAKISLFLEQFWTPFICQGRASTTQMGRLAAHLVMKLATVVLERGPSILVTRLHRWRPPPPSSPCSCGSPGDKDCIDDDLPRASSAEGHTPTPLIALIIMLVPWRNSSPEFILVSGSRWEILTPSLAFLLCGLKKTPVWTISKWSNVSISIVPSCFSMMCFQSGFSFVLFSQSVRCSPPLKYKIRPVSPAHFDNGFSHLLQFIC